MDTNNSVEFINQDDALSRVGGNLSLYKRLLGRFVEGNHMETLKTAINSGDMEEAIRQAHSLKGVSANLSLEKIRAATVDLEQLLKDNADYAQKLSELEESYTITAEKIAEMMD